MLDVAAFDLANARLLNARDCLQLAEAAVTLNSFNGAANRSYYCIFHAMRAVLALEGFDSKKHSGVMAAFREKYVKTGIFAARLSDIIRDVFRVRNDSDYKDFYIISKDDVKTQIENAREFLSAVESYISAKNQPNP